MIHEASIHQGDFNVLSDNGGVQEDGICVGIPSLLFEEPYALWRLPAFQEVD